MLRHKRSVHHHQKEESESSDTDQSFSDDLDATESDNEEAVDKYDPWDSLIQKTFERCQAGFKERVDTLTRYRRMEQEVARSKAYKELKPTFRKALMTSIRDRVIWFNAMQTDPIYKSIQNTAKNLIVMEDYSRDEAWKYAICKRKYLLDTVLDEFEPPEMDEMTLSEPDDDEPPRKRVSV